MGCVGICSRLPDRQKHSMERMERRDREDGSAEGDRQAEVSCTAPNSFPACTRRHAPDRTVWQPTPKENGKFSADAINVLVNGIDEPESEKKNMKG